MMSDSKQEDEKRKMLADLVAEYRNDADAMDRGELYQPTTEYLRRLLDRIEAAWEREREELDKRISDLEAYAKLWTGRADELRLKCDELYAKAKPVGNAAALREALIAMVRAETDGDMTLDALCGRCLSKLHGTCKHDGSCWCEKVIAAISAPARNVDKFTSLGDAINAWRETPPNESGCFDEWLLAPAAEREGE